MSCKSIYLPVGENDAAVFVNLFRFAAVVNYARYCSICIFVYIGGVLTAGEGGTEGGNNIHFVRNVYFWSTTITNN